MFKDSIDFVIVVVIHVVDEEEYLEFMNKVDVLHIKKNRLKIKFCK